MTSREAKFYIGAAVAVLLGLLAAVLESQMVQAAPTRYPYSTYQFTDQNQSDVCVYLFSDNGSTGGALAAVKIDGPCSQ